MVLHSPLTAPVFLFVVLYVLSTVSGSVLTTNRSRLPDCPAVFSVYSVWFSSHQSFLLSPCTFCILHSQLTIFEELFVFYVLYYTLLTANSSCLPVCPVVRTILAALVFLLVPGMCFSHN